MRTRQHDVNRTHLNATAQRKARWSYHQWALLLLHFGSAIPLGVLLKARIWMVLESADAPAGLP